MVFTDILIMFTLLIMCCSISSSEIVNSNCSATMISEISAIDCVIVYSFIKEGVAHCSRRQNNSLIFHSFIVETDNDEQKKTWKIVLINIGVLMLLTILIIVTFLIYRCKMNKTRNRELREILSILNGEKTNGGENKSEDKKPPLLRGPYEKKYELNKAFSIDSDMLLGTGQFGVVFEGRINGIDNDVKFKTTKCSRSVLEMKSLVAELKILTYACKRRRKRNYVY